MLRTGKTASVSVSNKNFSSPPWKIVGSFTHRILYFGSWLDHVDLCTPLLSEYQLCPLRLAINQKPLSFLFPTACLQPTHTSLPPSSDLGLPHTPINFSPSRSSLMKWSFSGAILVCFTYFLFGRPGQLIQPMGSDRLVSPVPSTSIVYIIPRFQKRVHGYIDYEWSKPDHTRAVRFDRPHFLRFWTLPSGINWYEILLSATIVEHMTRCSQVMLGAQDSRQDISETPERECLRTALIKYPETIQRLFRDEYRGRRLDTDCGRRGKG
jgi:hypothetical protein